MCVVNAWNFEWDADCEDGQCSSHSKSDADGCGGPPPPSSRNSISCNLVNVQANRVCTLYICTVRLLCGQSAGGCSEGPRWQLMNYVIGHAQSVALALWHHAMRPGECLYHCPTASLSPFALSGLSVAMAQCDMRGQRVAKPVRLSVLHHLPPRSDVFGIDSQLAGVHWELFRKEEEGEKGRKGRRKKKRKKKRRKGISLGGSFLIVKGVAG